MKKVYILAATLAAVAMFAIYQFAAYLETISRPENIERVSIVVANSDIAANTILTADMLRLTTLPREAVLANASTKVEELVGRLALVSCVSGEQMLLTQTAEQGDTAHEHLSLQLKEGDYAATISVSNITGTAGYIKEGDTVTLIAVLSSAVPSSAATIKVLYEHVPVVRVSESASRNAPGYNTLTVVFPKKDIFEFLRYQEMGVVRPVLESAFDAAMTQGGTNP